MNLIACFDWVPRFIGTGAILVTLVSFSAGCFAQQANADDLKEMTADDEASKAFTLRLEVYQKLNVTARRKGFLSEAFLAPGTILRKDQVIARLIVEKQLIEEKKLQAEAAALREQANNSSALVKARQDLKVSKMRSRELRTAAYQTSIPRLEIMEAETSVQINLAGLQGATSEKAQAGYRLAAKEAEVELVRVDIRDSIIRSPFDGIVFKQFKHVGEAVSDEVPIAEVYRLDFLLGSVLLQHSQVAPEAFSKLSGKVIIELPGIGKRDFEFETSGHLPRVERDGRYLAVIKVRNQRSKSSGGWILLPGMQGKLILQLDLPQVEGE